MALRFWFLMDCHNFVVKIVGVSWPMSGNMGQIGNYKSFLTLFEATQTQVLLFLFLNLSIRCFARLSCFLRLPVVQVHVLLGFADIVLENGVNWLVKDALRARKAWSTSHYMFFLVQRWYFQNPAICAWQFVWNIVTPV